MYDRFLKLNSKFNDQIIDEYKTSGSDKQEKILFTFMIMISVSPCKILQYVDLLYNMNISNEFINQFKDILESKITLILKNKEYDQFLNILRFLYICEYTNIFQSNLNDILDNLDEKTANLVFFCKNLEKQKLKLTKRDNSIQINYQINLTDNMKNEIVESTDNLMKIMKQYESTENIVGDVNIALYTLYSFHIDKKECLNQIHNYFDVSNFRELIIAIMIYKDSNEKNILFSKFFMVSLGKTEGFLSILYDYIDKHKNRFFNVILAMIYQNFYSYTEKNVHLSDVIHYTPQLHEEEIEKFKSLLTGEVAIEMLQICDLNNLKNFLPNEYNIIFPNEFIDNKTVLKEVAVNKNFSQVKSMEKGDFFTEFCKLSYPSISHFLTYLEIFSSQFSLSKNEQNLFLKIFFEINKKRFVYLSVILEKLLYFNIIDEDVAVNYSILQ